MVKIVRKVNQDKKDKDMLYDILAELMVDELIKKQQSKKISK